MHNKLTHRIFIPDSLKVKILSTIEEYPPDISNFKKDNLLYILSLISEIPARNKRGGLTPRGYTKIYSNLLQSYVYNYRGYLDYLIAHDIIKCDNFYIKEEKSYGYKINPEFEGLVEIIYIQNQKVVKNIRRHRRKQIKECKKYKELKKWMPGLEIDFDAALAYIKEQYEFRRQFPKKRTWDEKNNRFKNPLVQYNCALINLYDVRDKYFNFFVDDNVGRLHTVLTNMQSDLRNFITWKGQKLVTVDIRNSQPFLSTILFEPSFYFPSVNQPKNRGVSHFSTIFKHKTSIIHKTSNIITSILSNNTHPSLMSGKPLHNTDIQDIKLFTNLVEKGAFYKFLQNAFQGELDIKFIDDKTVKASVFLLLFTDNRYIGQKKAATKRIFKRYFPNVYKVFAALKRSDKTILPRLLQRIESLLILDIICKRIAKEKPQIPLFTIHDSITTTLENLDYVQRIMKEELTNYIGITPKFKVEYWDQANLKTNSNLLELSA